MSNASDKHKVREIKFSVIIPTYNRADVLPRAIESVLSQEPYSTETEIIIIDDCSTDGTRSLVENYKQQHKNIEFIKLAENSGGPAKPRNIGAKTARGDYIIFLDSDDELLPNALKIFNENWKKINKDDGKVGVIKARNLKGNTSKKLGWLQGKKKVLKYEDMICNLYHKGEFASCLKSEVVKTFKFDESVIGGEDLYWWEVSRKHNFLFLDIPVKRVYYQEQGISLSNKDINYFVNLSRIYYKKLKKYGSDIQKKCYKKYTRKMGLLVIFYKLAYNGRKSRNILKNIDEELKISSSAMLFFIYTLTFFPSKLVLFLYYSYKKLACIKS